ncbi:MAG: hypothetical protein ACTTKK_09475 [Ottowia sp.]
MLFAACFSFQIKREPSWLATVWEREKIEKGMNPPLRSMACLRQWRKRKTGIDSCIRAKYRAGMGANAGFIL